ncbi:MAG TPA: hypothetical protein VMZ22_01665 [Acidimicrobiales bacterium]|nr:hypothetical protein [Acidimicrobiales bacterium]
MKQVGFDALGVVMGAATFQVLLPQGCNTWGKFGVARTSGDLFYAQFQDTIERVWSEASRHLLDSARKAGAHGVAGVRATQSWLPGSSPVLQVQMVGSAVHVSGVAALRHPFASLLSIDDTLKLLLRGWVPTGVGVGVASVHVHAGAIRNSTWRRPFSNVEVELATRAMQVARETAEYRLRRSPGLNTADGVVGTNVVLSKTSEQCYTGTGLRIDAQITGTGVTRFGRPTAPIDAVVRLTKGAPDANV